MNTLGRRIRQLSAAGAEGGAGHLTRRAARWIYQRSNAAALEFPLLHADITDSQSVGRRLSIAAGTARGDSLTFAWVTTPPGAGSGGHTTMFRMVEALENAGHTCLILLFDRFGTSAVFHEKTIRANWPTVRARVLDAGERLADADVYVATSWPTAHVIGARPRASDIVLYFIQDYEPHFYAHGSEHALAADTYNFGFHNIALGSMVSSHLEKNSMPLTATLPFGCDTSTYKLTNHAVRDGVVFYSRPDTPRRGALLVTLALEQFHRRHPEQVIHVLGDLPLRSALPVTRHPNLPPATLADLYNTAAIGIGMSFTNISLVVEEMLACGLVPVVNDSVDARADISSLDISWGVPTPSGIADALDRALAASRNALGLVTRAKSVRLDGWDDTAAAFVRCAEASASGQPHRRVAAEGSR